MASKLAANWASNMSTFKLVIRRKFSGCGWWPFAWGRSCSRRWPSGGRGRDYATANLIRRVLPPAQRFRRAAGTTLVTGAMILMVARAGRRPLGQGVARCAAEGH